MAEDRTQWGQWHYRGGGWVVGRLSCVNPDWVLLQGPTHEETTEYVPVAEFDVWSPLGEPEVSDGRSKE